MRLVRTAARHPVSVLMVYAAILTFALVSFRQLPQELLPDLPLPAARVICEYQGLPAEEIEDLITVPVENALSAVEGVRTISSVSRDELSAVRLEFDWGVDQNEAAVQIREKVDALYPFLPYGSSKPLVLTGGQPDEQPVLTLAVVPRGGSQMRDIGNLVRGELCTRLKQVPGVATVRIVGLVEPEIKIEVDGDKLTAAGIPLRRFVGIVASSVYRAPLGTVVEGSREYTVEATTDVDTLAELSRVPIPTSGSGSVPLSHFARVCRDRKEPTSFFHHNGVEAIGIYIEKTPESGSLNTVRNLRGTLKRLRSLFAGELELRVIDDPTEEIERGIRNLLLAMACACIAVFLVLLILFRSAAVSLIVSASIPASSMVVFIYMKFAGIGLNLISLSGIAIGIGLIVDNSIVVVDSLIQGRVRGAEGIASAAGKTTTAMVGSTLTTLLVFLPVVFLPGVSGSLFRDLALTVSCLLIASLMCALTLTPALYSLCSKRSVLPTRRVQRLEGIGLLYSKLLRIALRRPWTAHVLTVCFALAGLTVLMVIPKSIVPASDVRKLEIRVEFPQDTPIRESLSLSQDIASELLTIEGIESVFASAGYDRDCLADRCDPDRDPRRVFFRVAAGPGNSPFSSPVLVGMEELLNRFPGIRYTVYRPANPVSRLLGDTDVLVYRLAGLDREMLLSEAQLVSERIEASGLARSVWIDTRRDKQRIELKLDGATPAGQRAEPAAVLESLRTALQGRVAAQLPAEGRRIDVRIRLDPDQTASYSRLGKIHVPVADDLVETGILGVFESSISYDCLHRIDRRPAVSIAVQPLVGAKTEVAALLSSKNMAHGELLRTSALRRNQTHILLVFAFALLMMYLMIGAQFESFVLPLLLIASLIPALSGSLFVLLVCGYSLNINSFLGILILAGTAINISIILTVAMRSNGLRNREELVRVCGNRLVPVGATVLSTVIAMIPVAVVRTGGEGALQSNTAVALIGGLIVGFFVIMFVFPALFDSLMRTRFSRRK
jgi:HAE1 family hydrophobic/amphiphilic exporter-1